MKKQSPSQPNPELRSSQRGFSRLFFIASLFIALLPSSLCADGFEVFPSTILELGEFPAETEQTGTFTLTNTTDRMISIKQVTSCCAFITPILYEKKIAPGHSTPLDILVDARLLEGSFTKTLTLTTSDPKNPETTLWIKGIANPALTTAEPHLFSGWIPQNQEWNTNLTIHVRSGITNEIHVASMSGFTLEHHLDKQGQNYRLHLRIPPHKKAESWKTKLEIKASPSVPPLNINIEGHIGTQLLPQTAVVRLSKKTTTFSLIRKAANLKNTSAAPLQTNTAGINIKEQKSTTPGKSTVTIHLTESLFLELKEKQRLPLQLTANGCIPAVIILEYQPE